MTKCPAPVLDKTCVGQFHTALFTSEAAWMPAGVHRFYHPSNDEFAAFTAARGKKYVEVMLAVLATVKLVEHPISELAKALSANKTLLMP